MGAVSLTPSDSAIRLQVPKPVVLDKCAKLHLSMIQVYLSLIETQV
jgi:hypothetical protein